MIRLRTRYNVLETEEALVAQRHNRSGFIVLFNRAACLQINFIVPVLVTGDASGDQR